MMTHVTGDPDDRPFVRIDCHQRFVVTVVDLGQICEVPVAQAFHRSEEPLITGDRRYSFEGFGQELLVLRADLPDQDFEPGFESDPLGIDQVAHGSMSPCLMAYRTNSTRSRMPSFFIALAR